MCHRPKAGHPFSLSPLYQPAPLLILAGLLHHLFLSRLFAMFSTNWAPVMICRCCRKKHKHSKEEKTPKQKQTPPTNPHPHSASTSHPSKLSLSQATTKGPLLLPQTNTASKQQWRTHCRWWRTSRRPSPSLTKRTTLLLMSRASSLSPD